MMDGYVVFHDEYIIFRDKDGEIIKTVQTEPKTIQEGSSIRMGGVVFEVKHKLFDIDDESIYFIAHLL